MITYNSKIIYEFAERLYNRAEQLIFTYTFIGILMGLILGLLIGKIFGGLALSIIITMSIFGIIGYLTGLEMAFWCKLAAQLTLCQVKIEENTNKTTFTNNLTLTNSCELNTSKGKSSSTQEKGIEIKREIEGKPIDDSILSLDKNDEFTWLEKGKYWLQKKDDEKAIECFNKVITIYSRFTEAWIKKGIALINLGKHNEALQCFNKALEIHPDSSEAREYKEQVLKALGR
jgi:tetratricopeptide (TPR) repeat protein